MFWHARFCDNLVLVYGVVELDVKMYWHGKFCDNFVLFLCCGGARCIVGLAGVVLSQFCSFFHVVMELDE